MRVVQTACLGPQSAEKLANLLEKKLHRPDSLFRPPTVWLKFKKCAQELIAYVKKFKGGIGSSNLAGRYLDGDPGLNLADIVRSGKFSAEPILEGIAIALMQRILANAINVSKRAQN